MMTSSAKRTLTGLVFNLAFLAALMNADLGDFGKRRERKKNTQCRKLKDNHLVFGWLMCFFSQTAQFKDLATVENTTPNASPLSTDVIKGGSVWGRYWQLVASLQLLAAGSNHRVAWGFTIPLRNCKILTWTPPPPSPPPLNETHSVLLKRQDVGPENTKKTWNRCSKAV